MNCDSHFHVFGPAERFPYAADLRYKPPHEGARHRAICIRPAERTDELFALLESWAPAAAARRRILQDNPARLFGF